MRDAILLRNNLVELEGEKSKSKSTVSISILATVLSNLTYFGYTPSKEVYTRLSRLSDDQIKVWWSKVEPVLKDITGDSKKMADFVVYKNFPKEVLNMSEVEYWIKQILMYIGLPNDLFTQEEEDRECMLEKLTLKVLHLANSNSLKDICDSLLRNPARWTAAQFEDIKYLVINERLSCDIASIVFKENMASLVARLIGSGITINIKSATDVLRLAVGMSDGDVSMREASKFRSFNRKERRFFLGLLEGSTSLQEDMARRRNKWKKFMRALRPNDYGKRFKKVSEAYNALYHNQLITFNSQVEGLIRNKDEGVLYLLQNRGGEYVRRLHKMIDLFGKDAVTQFSVVLPELSVIQLLKISKYVEQINDRRYRTFPPRGNWTKLQIVESDRNIPIVLRDALLEKINKEIAKRIRVEFATVNLSDSAKMVKLQTSDSELTNYGRGTEFPIPENVKFIRTASYWEKKGGFGNTWFDNGWNFFDNDWKSVGYCCWNNVGFGQGENAAAVFSGDPTNSKEMKGRACQMIDLYLDRLENHGVRYAVWNILCYSHIKFDDAEEVYAAMQWGEDAQKGKLFEPSRCQLSFPVKGDHMTKYIAYIDIKERKVVYMDANLYGQVSSAGKNSDSLQEKMPAFQEYLATLPSVYDIFKGIRKSKDGLPVAYDDAGLKLDGGKAFIFKPVNEDNTFEQVDLSKLLG